MHETYHAIVIPSFQLRKNIISIDCIFKIFKKSYNIWVNVNEENCLYLLDNFSLRIQCELKWIFPAYLLKESGTEFQSTSIL